MTTPLCNLKTLFLEFISGFMPIHVAIANGLTAMFEFLTNLPDVDRMSCYMHILTGVSNLNTSSFLLQTGFMPIHVAIANGLTAMFEFLTNLPDVDRMHVEWEQQTQRELALVGAASQVNH